MDFVVKWRCNHRTGTTFKRMRNDRDKVEEKKNRKSYLKANFEDEGQLAGNRVQRNDAKNYYNIWLKHHGKRD